jgi:cell division septation protein DedD
MSYQFGQVERDERIEYLGEEPPHEELPPRWRLPPAALAVAVMAVFAGGLWFAYHEGAKHAATATGSAASDQVPLIHADNQPIKVKPDNPGGMNIPDQNDPIYARKAGAPPVEKLLPPPEQPAPRPTAPPAATTAPPPPAASAPGTQAAAVPQAPAKPGTPAKPATVQPAPTAKPTPTAAGDAKIQLASLRTPEAARDEWQRLKRDNADLLGRFTAVAVRAEVADKGTYYRVEAGPVGDRAAAERLCKALKERGLGCSLVR